MGDAHQKLTVEAEAKGFGETAGEVKKVSNATEELQDKTAGGAEATAKKGEAQEKLNAGESDYVELIRQINPALGGLADAMIKGAKVAGDMASQDLNATAALGKLTTSIRNNWAAWKLIIVGGGAIVATYLAITHALKKVREEQEAVTKATQDQVAAMTALRGEQRDAQAELERLADTRREGGYTAEEARAAAQQVERVRGRRPDLDAEAVSQAVAMGGAGRGIDETAGIAWLIQSGRLQLDPGQGADTRDRAITRALERHAEALAKATERETTQDRELYRSAGDQIRGRSPGSLERLIEVIERLTPGEGVDADRMARILPFLEEAQASGAWNLESLLTGNLDAFNRALKSAMKEQGLERGEELSRSEMATAERLLQAIERQADTSRTMKEAAETINEAADKIAAQGGGVVHNFGRYTFPDAATQRRHTRNGENQLLQRVGQ